MRIFWHEGGLHIHPESEREGRMLVEIVDRLKFEKPPEMLTSPSFCTSTNERVYITARACEFEFGATRELQAAGAGGL
jgi:hypothetical protein